MVRRRAASRGLRQARAGTGAREGEGETAGKLPHHHVVLRGWSIDGGRQRKGGAAAGRSSSCNGGSGARVLSGAAAAAWGDEAWGCGGLSRGG
jgi:hypothetical protein